MNCLVLGGAGFIGSHLVDTLVLRGHSVRVFDLPNVSTQNLQQSLRSIEIMNGDFENISDVSPALDDMDVVVHLVSTTMPAPSNLNPVYDVETNVIGTIKMLDEAVKKGVKKIVFASSGGTIYGIPQFLPIPETDPTNPICSHGIGKLAIEKYLALYHHLYGLDYTILRFGNPYGPRQRTKGVQGAVAVFLGHVLADEQITIWGDGSVARDFFYIDDLVSALVRVIELDSKSKVYNIATGRSESLKNILSVIQDVTGKKPYVTYQPPRKLDVPVSCLDISKAMKELDWTPRIGLTEGIAKTWKWLVKKEHD
jgi:UDP-glucose 4-epimerase